MSLPKPASATKKKKSQLANIQNRGKDRGPSIQTTESALRVTRRHYKESQLLLARYLRG